MRLALARSKIQFVMKEKLERLRILVVGDWLLDEHWVLGTHRIASSSRTGLKHSRALNTKDSTVRSLCGAGKVASVLYEAHESCDGGSPRFCFDIAGLGLWDSKDGDSLRRALEPHLLQRDTHHSMSSPPSYDLRTDDPDAPTPRRNPEDAKLYNLAGATHGINPGTTHVIRLYQQETSKFTLTERIDWEVRLSEKQKTQIKNNIAQFVQTELPKSTEMGVFS